jgi:DNA-binding transcriptional MerR regulator
MKTDTPIERLRRVGELARETGLTVRTLHHYDEIGLLSPSARSEAGYRLYGQADIARLQQIRSLRMLGFALDEIRSLLDGGTLSPLRVVELHLKRVKEQITAQRALARRLETLASWLEADGEPQTDDVIEAIEVMTMTERVQTYYTPEQLQQLEQRRHAIGDERLQEVEQEWPRLIAEMQAEFEQGTDPASPRVQELAGRWKSLIEEFTGGDPGITASLQRMYEKEPEVRERAGTDPELMAYVQQAMQIRSSQ